MSQRIAILFKDFVSHGVIIVNHGRLADLAPNQHDDNDKSVFELYNAPYRLEIELHDVMVSEGAFATRISVKTDHFGFSFFFL